MKNINPVIDTMNKARKEGSVEVWKNWNSSVYGFEYLTSLRDIQVIVTRGQDKLGNRQCIQVVENDLHEYIFDLVGSGYVMRIEQHVDPDPKEAWENTRARLVKMVEEEWSGSGLIAKEDLLHLMPKDILHRFKEAVCNYMVEYHYTGKIDFLVGVSKNKHRRPVKGVRIWAKSYGDGDDKGEDVLGFNIYPETFWKDVESLEYFIRRNLSAEE